MRNLFTGAITSLGLAVLVAGSAAADSYSLNNAQPVSDNQALHDQLTRDMSSGSILRESPLGQIVVHASNAPSTTDRADRSAFTPGSSPWLAQAPDGQLVPTTQAPAMHDERG